MGFFKQVKEYTKWTQEMRTKNIQRIRQRINALNQKEKENKNKNKNKNKERWTYTQIQRAKKSAENFAIAEIKNGISEKLLGYLDKYYENDFSEFGTFSNGYEEVYKEQDQKQRIQLFRNYLKENATKSRFGRKLYEAGKNHLHEDTLTTNQQSATDTNDSSEFGAFSVSNVYETMHKTHNKNCKQSIKWPKNYLKGNAAKSRSGRKLCEDGKDHLREDTLATNQQSATDTKEKVQTMYYDYLEKVQIITNYLYFNYPKMVKKHENLMQEPIDLSKLEKKDFENLAAYLVTTKLNEKEQTEQTLQQTAKDALNTVNFWYSFCEGNNHGDWGETCPKRGYIWWMDHPPKKDKELYEKFFSKDMDQWDELALQLYVDLSN